MHKNSQPVHQYLLNTYYVLGVLVNRLEEWLSSISQHQNHLQVLFHRQIPEPHSHVC